MIAKLLGSQPSHAAGVVKLFAPPVVLLSASSDSEDGHRKPADGETPTKPADGETPTKPAAGETLTEEETGTVNYESETGAQDQLILAETSTGDEQDAFNASPLSVANRRSLAEASASVQGALDGLEKTPYCAKCTYPIQDIFRAKLYGKQSGKPTFICHACNCVITMVSKHMDLSQLADNGLSFASLQMTTTGEEFFKQAREAAEEHGQLRWNQVRELLTSALTERRIQLVTISYTDKEYPLSVWVTKGFDAEDLIKRGKRVDHPVFQDVYRAPLKETCRANVMHP